MDDMAVEDGGGGSPGGDFGSAPGLDADIGAFTSAAVTPDESGVTVNLVPPGSSSQDLQGYQPLESTTSPLGGLQQDTWTFQSPSSPGDLSAISGSSSGSLSIQTSVVSYGGGGSAGPAASSSASDPSGWVPTVSSNPPELSWPPAESGGNAAPAPDPSDGDPGDDGIAGLGSGGGGSSGGPAAGPDLQPRQQVVAAITQIYESILGRAPDAGGLSTYGNAMLSGRMTLGQVAQSVAQSPEAAGDLDAIISDVQGRQATTADQPWVEAQQAALGNGSTTLAGVRQGLASFSGEAGVVASMYQGLVGRAPSAAEISATEAQLASGVSLQSIRSSGAGSPEAVAQLNAIYQSVLGRQADVSGLATYKGELASGGTLAQVREQVAQSAEAQGDLDGIISDVQGRQATPADQPWVEAQKAALGNGSTTLAGVRQGLATYSGEAGVVTGLYQGLVGRAPSTAEVSATEAQLASGVSLQSIRTADASSPEVVGDLDGIISDVQGRQATAADQPWMAAQEAALANGSTTLAGVRQSLATYSGEAGVVTGLYQGVVGRAPSAAEIGATEAQLASGVSLQAIRSADARSPEATADLGTIYQNVLGRQADASGLATWEDALAGGTNLAQVQQTIAQSPEAQSDLDAIISDVQGRQATAADQPWMEAQEAALGDGSTSLNGVKQALTQYTAASTPGQVTLALGGVAYAIPGWHMQEISYTKRAPEAREALRTEFQTVRTGFLKSLAANDAEQLRQAGLTDVDLQRMANGKVPTGYQVHHILPLDDGGTNDPSNLILIKRQPDHSLLTAYQNTMTASMIPGQTVELGWPVPVTSTLIWPSLPGAGATAGAGQSTS